MLLKYTFYIMLLFSYVRHAKCILYHNDIYFLKAF